MTVGVQWTMDGTSNALPAPPILARAVVLDLECVLIELMPWEQWLTVRLQQVIDGPVEPILQRWYRSDLLRCANTGLIPLWHAWYDYLLTVEVPPGLAEELVIGLRCRYEHAISTCRMSCHTATVLTQLQQSGIDFAVLADCSWSEHVLNEVFQQLQLPVELRYSATTAMLKMSGDDGPAADDKAGARNPYAHLLNCLNWRPQDTVYVGWNYRPLTAARQAGMTTIRLNGNAAATADYVICDLRELTELVGFDRRQEAPQQRVA